MKASLFILLFLTSFNFSNVVFADSTWEKLFHYDKGRVLIPSKEFLSTYENNHNFSVKAEIQYWESVFSTSNNDAICNFPARYLWWSQTQEQTQDQTHAQANTKVLHPEDYCPDLKKFMSEFDIKKVYIVFSSYYAQNSASLFGHTFLRFMRSNSKGQELLDWGVSYSANMMNMDPIRTIYKSFFSTFEGSLQLLPYYYKVREYNDFEFRPLWSYELNLDQTQIKFLLYHLWELSKIKIPYQYLTHNCSSLVLDMLAIIKPEVSLRDDLAFYHIPIDTVKVLKKHDLLQTDVNYRPSLMQEWEDKYHKLNVEQKVKLHNFLSTKEIKLLDEVELVDAAIDYYDFKFGKELLAAAGEFTQLKNEKDNLLIKRTKFPKSQKQDIKPLGQSPDVVHATRRIGLGLSKNDADRNRLYLNYRFAYHDPIDPIEGMTSRMKINFMQPEVSYDEDKSFKLEKLELLDIASWSYSPSLSHSLSYELGISWQRWLQAFDETRQMYWTKGVHLQAAAGFTFDLSKISYMAVMLEQQLTYAQNRPDDFGYKIGPQLMFHTDYENYRFRVTGKNLFEVTGYQNESRKFESVDASISISIKKDYVLSFKTHTLQ